MHAQAARLIRGSDLVITNCEEYADKLKALGGSPQVIPVGSGILPSGAAEKGPKKTVVFGMFGRLTAERNPVTGLRILSAAKKEGIDGMLFLLGCAQSSNPAAYEGLMNEARKEGLEKQVVASGDLSPAELSDYLDRTDVFLFPQTQGISTRNTSVMAALAHGLPVISYAPEGGHFKEHPLPEGALAGRGSEAAFIRAALQYSKKALAGEINRAANRNYFLKYFSWDKIRGAFLQAMEAA
jgi:glycosyltransferase involved in cell wall biosynthesis